MVVFTGLTCAEDLFVEIHCHILSLNPCYVHLATQGCWTAWFDRDNPSGHGDFETLLELHKENPSKICDHPIQIEVKTTSGASVGSTHNVIHANRDQPPNGLCADYKSSFFMTQWYNHDNPSGTGDFELLEKLRVKNPNEICPFPLDIEVQTVAGNTVDPVLSDTTIGFICQNADQEGGRCSDYKLRFVCPIDFCNRRG
uniref:WxxW domain-containing protein n=1 Tax=Hippocampus comes TaxID=109280 RepID=A0A3Q2YXZ4_HIPCM